MSENKLKDLTGSYIKNTGISLTVGLLSFVIALAICSFIILKSNVSDDSCKYLILASSAVAAFICSIFSAMIQKRRKLIIAMLTVILLLIIKFMLLLCFNNLHPDNSIYLIIPADITTGLIGSVIGSNIIRK